MNLMKCLCGIDNSYYGHGRVPTYWIADQRRHSGIVIEINAMKKFKVMSRGNVRTSLAPIAFTILFIFAIMLLVHLLFELAPTIPFLVIIFTFLIYHQYFYPVVSPSYIYQLSHDSFCFICPMHLYILSL